MPLLRRPTQHTSSAFVGIDAATRRNLELTETMAGDRQGSLLATVDSTVTAPGARLLAQRLTAPSCNPAMIEDRLAAVAHFFTDTSLRTATRTTLKRCPDLERALGRLALGRGGPRDLIAVRGALQQSQTLADLIDPATAPPVIQTAAADAAGHQTLTEQLHTALSDDGPTLARDGGFVRESYSPELDDLRALRDEARTFIAGLQAQYADRTGIAALKVKHNNVLGYFIETTATHADKMMSPPLNSDFIHRQTTANAVRFTTVELSELETKILNAAGSALSLELEIFEQLRQAVLDHAADLYNCARAIATLDVASACAQQAARCGWTRPMIHSDRRFDIRGGRHPVVEAALDGQAANFVANDCDLNPDGGAIWLLTGPNMAGKSTFLRQNALIALLAQAGFYVPAAHADIGLVSQIFSRVGASDDLARGRSTFMVEMIETAAILNHADDRALVILDEIGRGTSTYDGLSIAWATLEHLHDINKCRALFATHYHELTQVADRLDNTLNATVAVREWQGDVIFLHEVRKGAADRSYGVQVAKLAGLPQSVLDRAKVVLDALEAGEGATGQTPKAIIDDLPLFSATPPPAPTASNPTADILQNINPDMLTAKEALDLIYRLKESVGKD